MKRSTHHCSYANYDPTCVSAVLTPFNQYLPFILVVQVIHDLHFSIALHFIKETRLCKLTLLNTSFISHQKEKVKRVYSLYLGLQQFQQLVTRVCNPYALVHTSAPLVRVLKPWSHMGKGVSGDLSWNSHISTAGHSWVQAMVLELPSCSHFDSWSQCANVHLELFLELTLHHFNMGAQCCMQTLQLAAQ